MSLGSEDIRISGESLMGWRFHLSLLSCWERCWCFLPLPSTLAREASESPVKCILFIPWSLWHVSVDSGLTHPCLAKQPVTAFVFPWTRNHSECESWHRTVGGQDAGWEILGMYSQMLAWGWSQEQQLGSHHSCQELTWEILMDTVSLKHPRVWGKRQEINGGQKCFFLTLLLQPWLNSGL